MKNKLLVNKIIHSMKIMLSSNNNIIQVLDVEGNLYDASCSFYNPATETEILNLENKIGNKLPLDYIHFLKHCNGCTLFDDVTYGGENVIFAVERVLANHEADTYNPKILKIAYIYGDFIIIDLEKVKNQEKDYLFRCSIGESERVPFKSNFETWFARFVTSQGQKFWEW